MLDKLFTLIAIIILVLVAGAMIANWDSMTAIGPAVGDAGSQAIALMLLCARVVLVLGVVGALLIGGIWAWSKWQEDARQRDGSHRLRKYRVRDAVTGDLVTVLVNPDLMVTPALAVSGRGVHELGNLPTKVYETQAKERARVSAMQALAPGDKAIMSSNGSMYRPAGLLSGAGRMWNGKDKQVTEQREEKPDPQLAPPSTPMLPLMDALRHSTPDRFVLGYNQEMQKPAVWSPREHLNLGVFGVSGTGKTKSTGFQVMLMAAKHGYHVICLDPKGGADFGPFAPHVEWQPSDAYTFPDQLNAIYDVHEARHRIMKDRNVGEWHMLGSQAGPDIVLVLEEFGTMREEIASRKGGGKTLASVDHTVEMIFRLARMTGIHVVILDQAPEKLDPVVLGGCKLRLAYQLESSQASRLKEYEADTLPASGAFMVHRKPYQSWLVATELPRLLRSVPPFAHQRLLPAPNAQPNGTERQSPEVANDRTPPNAPNDGQGTAPIPPLPEPPFDVRSAPKRDLIFWWRDNYKTGSQAEFRTWLADHGGSIAKGYISDTFALWAQERAGTLSATETISLDQLRAQGLDIRIEGAGGTYDWDAKE